MAVLCKSNRVVLRNLRADDLHAFQGYRHDPDVARFQSWSAQDDQQALSFLTAMADRPALTAGEWTQIAIADRASDRLLGDMGLHLSGDGANVELGITLARSAQGQGLATAAMRLAIDLVWSHPDVTTLRTWADQRNIASVRLCHRLGLTYLGAETADGVVEDAFILHRPASR